MTTRLKQIAVFICTLSLALLGSCRNDKDDTSEVTESAETTSGVMDNRQISAQNVFNSIPARAEIIRLIGESKIEYNPDLLNNPEVASKYSLENSRALNLGVYGTDLSIAGAFDQTQESMLFLGCVNTLAKNLGVSTAFDQRMMDRMEAYKENRDSTLEIIVQSYKKADIYLKENGRPGTSALILSGAWIEGIYVSGRIAQDSPTEGIIKTILKQQESLKHLVTMLEASNLGDDAKYILDGLHNLQSAFNAASEKNTCTIETVKDICGQVTSLRKKVVETF